MSRQNPIKEMKYFLFQKPSWRQKKERKKERAFLFKPFIKIMSNWNEIEHARDYFNCVLKTYKLLDVVKRLG